jgi:hypothetical protein
MSYVTVLTGCPERPGGGFVPARALRQALNGRVAGWLADVSSWSR